MGKLIQGWASDEFMAPRAIWDTKLPAEVKIAYLYLVDQMKDGQPNPSIPEIMNACGLKRTKTKEAMRQMRQMGLIEAQEMTDEETGAQAPNRYIVYHPQQIQGIEWRDKEAEKGKPGRPEKTLVEIRPGINPRQNTTGDKNPRSEYDPGQKKNHGQNTTGEKRVSSYSSLSNPSNPSDPSIYPSSAYSLNKKIKKAWKEFFKTDLTEIEVEELLSHGLTYQEMRDYMRRIYLYNVKSQNKKKIDVKYVSGCFFAHANGKPWEWLDFALEANHETPRKKYQLGNRSTKKSKSGQRDNKGKEDDLPRSVQQAEARGEIKSEPVDPETEARLKAKLSELNQQLERKRSAE